ncbi:hypothetical protein FC64_GL000187 [Ligilactobacillus araffinosus DSM 20653]|uniref:Uncharacterized protein n=1 Tax=Ligilactobacillus araffinosus DSM 20653 TaxID=1423820 RepID=A0A0R1ZDZ0_9LACO|nr:hypothetical protein FC64_GL000187 [Ligilactobacillus araffinosus DSM 20653]
MVDLVLSHQFSNLFCLFNNSLYIFNFTKKLNFNNSKIKNKLVNQENIPYLLDFKN